MLGEIFLKLEKHLLIFDMLISNLPKKVLNKTRTILNPYLPLSFKSGYTIVHHFINNDTIKTKFTFINYLSFFYTDKNLSCNYEIGLFDPKGKLIEKKLIYLKPFGSKLVDINFEFKSTIPKYGMFYAKVFNGSFLDLKFKNSIEKLESPYFATYIQSQSKSIETVHTLNKLDLPPLIDKEWISYIKINPGYLSYIDVHQINPSKKEVKTSINLFDKNLNLIDSKMSTLKKYGSRIERFDIKKHHKKQNLRIGLKGLTGRNAKPMLMFHFKDGTFSGCHS